VGAVDHGCRGAARGGEAVSAGVDGILQLIKGLGRGGAEQLLVDLGRRFDRDRFRHEFAYLLPWKDALAEELRDQGYDVNCLEGGRGVGWVDRLRRLVRDRGIRLVHAHSPYAAIGARVALAGTRLVYTEHNLWPRYHRATYWGNLLTFPRNEHVFTVSDEVRDSIRYPPALGFLSTPPVETLYHGVDLERLDAEPAAADVREEIGIPPDAPLVGTVGNFTPKKAHADLVEALPMIRHDVPDARLVLVGLGPLEADLRQRVRRLGLDDAVVFAGFRTDAPRLAAAFDVFVLPSRFEGLSIALLEAMALGRAVVATRVGGNAEVIEDRTSGVLVPAGDRRSLAGAVTGLLQDDALREKLGREARRRAARFDIGVAAARMEEVYGRLLGG
jgi:glycosyltransferase involved in cell wall biosynthesis